MPAGGKGGEEEGGEGGKRGEGREERGGEREGGGEGEEERGEREERRGEGWGGGGNEIEGGACKVHCKMNSLTNDVCDLVPCLSILFYQLCTNTSSCADLRDHVISCDQ